VIHPQPDHLACDFLVWLEPGQFSLVFKALPGAATARLLGGLAYGAWTWHVARLAGLLTSGHTLREHRDRPLGADGEAARSYAD